MKDGTSQQAQLVSDEGEALGVHRKYDTYSGSGVTVNAWHTITCTVDNIEQVMTIYLDGEKVNRISNADALIRDGPFALRPRLALFYTNEVGEGEDEGEGEEDEPSLSQMARRFSEASVYFLRSATVHSRVLTADDASNEHATLQSLLIRDAIASAPMALRAVIEAEHSMRPLASPSACSRFMLSCA